MAQAEPAQRLVARIVDTFVVGLPVVVVTRVALPVSAAGVAMPVGLAVLLLLYDSVLVGMWGRTLGKRLVGIKVVQVAGPAGGGPVLRAVLRAAVYVIPIALRPVPVLGVLAGLFWVADVALILDRPRGQALHDRIAGTGVEVDG
jgi:uncharacterized RDD family membrane protein YckC